MFFNEAHAADILVAGTELARGWDHLWNFLVWLSVFFFILVVGGMMYLVLTYRAGSKHKPQYITGSHTLEALWTAIPTVLLLVIFVWGYVLYGKMVHSPSDALEVRVVAKQWLFQFQYPETGRTTINEVYVPINKPIKLVMSSEDVLHSFFIPNFRVKSDIVPGMFTSVWFEANVPGKHQVFCTEYCGTSHSQMLAQVIALSPEDYEAWKAGKKFDSIPRAGQTLAEAQAEAAKIALKQSAPVSLADQGKVLTETKGCIACHSADGSVKVGPSYKGLYGHEVELADGSKVTADENYLRESIENPNAKIVKGFQPVMPTFKGLISETELNAILAYIKSVK